MGNPVAVLAATAPAPVDNTTLVVGIISAVMLFAGSAGLWSWIQSRSERPIKKAEVETAAIMGLAGVDGVYAELFDNLTAEVKRQGEQLKGQAEALKEQDKRLKELERDLQAERSINGGLRAIVRRAVAYIDDLHTNWEYHRRLDRPPRAPDLADDRDQHERSQPWQ